MLSSDGRSATAALPRLDLPPAGSSQRYPASVPAWARPKSPSSSIRSRSSRSGSPANEDKHSRPQSPDIEEDVLALSAGCQPDEIYKRSMPAWRYRIRKTLVKGVEWESPILSKIQKSTRAGFLDTYFIWSSILGTHAAFMIGLPVFFWFGYAETARGLVNILAFGVYTSSVIKDLVCVPRPYTPPVERLSISSHGLEYGFPSTHSTNAVSVSLYFAQLYLQSLRGDESFLQNSIVVGLCALYGVSVVAGRIYCGMHSMTDCIAGTLLGTAIWYANVLFTPIYESFLEQSGPAAPTLITPLCLALIFIHPEPVDDCPCFEDAIAFVATAGGIALGRWYNVYMSQVMVATRGTFTLDEGARHLLFTWLACALVKVILGVSIILSWRIIAKRALHILLPPTFDFFRPIIDLPRRHYQRASGYREVEKSNPIHAVPSVLDLTTLGSPSLEVPSFINDQGELSVTPSPTTTNFSEHPAHHLHVVGTSSTRPNKKTLGKGQKSGLPVKDLHPVHYDIDVLTKVGVYAGIGYIATCSIPLFFRYIGLDS